jgi:hypothetical protein
MLDFGFHKIGSLFCAANTIGGETTTMELTTPIVRSVQEPWTISALVYLIPNPADPYQEHIIFTSGYNDGQDEFTVRARGVGDGENVGFEIYSKSAAYGTSVTYTNATIPDIAVGMGYNRWFHIALYNMGSAANPTGEIVMLVDGYDVDNSKYVVTGSPTSFSYVRYLGIPVAGARFKYFGSGPNGETLHGFMADVVYHDKALSESYDRSYAYTTTFKDIPQRYRILHGLTQLGAVNHNDTATNGEAYSYSGPSLDHPMYTAMLYRTTRDAVNVVSNYDTITLTDYDSAVTPILVFVHSDYDTITLSDYSTTLVGPVVEDIYGPYSFPTRTSGDVLEWTWYNPTSTTSYPSSGTSRTWSWDSNDTPSAGVGPTSGQGGNPEGYVYTESSSATLGDEFFMEFNTTFDTTTYSEFKIEFYTNQRGNDNNATCQVQLNESGGGWTNYGPEFGGPTDPDKVASSGVQIWSYRNVDLSASNNASTLLRIKVKLGLTGSNFHNDYGIDTITITGNAPR